MRLENNGVNASQSSGVVGVDGRNGASSSPFKAAGAAGASNGTAVRNGTGKLESESRESLFTTLEPPTPKPDYFGHDREEVTRILIQALVDLGYRKAANVLEDESEYALESPYVSDFRRAVLRGQWAQAETLLRGMDIVTPEVDTNVLLFYLRQQKYLELLEIRDVSRAIQVLRTELAPLNYSIEKLHFLSSLMMCINAEDLRKQADWDGADGISRQVLLSELSKFISPSIMIPEHRLASLLDQVKQTQIANCLYHNSLNPPSLYSDHLCDRAQFPRCTVHQLKEHSDEVYCVKFSHDGRRMASASKDKNVIIWDVENDFTKLWVLADHRKDVTYVDWSPDDSRLISCSRDCTAKVWDTNTGACLVTLSEFGEPVSSASWSPDGQTFVTGSLDPFMMQWDINGKMLQKSASPRIYDLKITPDGQKIVAVCTQKQLHVYNFLEWKDKISYPLGTQVTCVDVSKDSRYALVNTAAREVQLVDIGTGKVMRRYLGQVQDHWVIRGCFGGAGENFVVSGSEDSHIYIWHKQNDELLEKLSGHLGTVNCVAWNPTVPHMLASAGDDRTIRIWSRVPLSPQAKGKMKDLTLDGFAVR